MADEVELDLEDFGADRNGRGAEPARGDIERHLPAMVEPGGERQADFADDLQPKLQGRGRVAPFWIGKLGPNRTLHEILPTRFNAQMQVIETGYGFQEATYGGDRGFRLFLHQPMAGIGNDKLCHMARRRAHDRGHRGAKRFLAADGEDRHLQSGLG